MDRDEHGKEKRFPVILNAKEKLIARKVSLAFQVIDAILLIVLPWQPYIANCVWV